MNTTFSPLISVFDSAEQEADYTAWLKAKAEASLADTREVIPHDEVMAEMDALIATVAAQRDD